jgi:hypothetical protein
VRSAELGMGGLGASGDFSGTLLIVFKFVGKKLLALREVMLQLTKLNFIYITDVAET